MDPPPPSAHTFNPKSRPHFAIKSWIRASNKGNLESRVSYKGNPDSRTSNKGNPEYRASNKGNPEYRASNKGNPESRTSSKANPGSRASKKRSRKTYCGPSILLVFVCAWDELDLLRSYVGNWVKIGLPKQSHDGANRHKNDPISQANFERLLAETTIKWTPLCSGQRYYILQTPWSPMQTFLGLRHAFLPILFVEEGLLVTVTKP